MMDNIRDTVRRAVKRPGKTILQLMLIAAGALAFSAGLSIAGSLVNLERDTYRYRVSVASGTSDEAGRFRYSRPSLFTLDSLETLVRDSGVLGEYAAVNSVQWPAVSVDDSRFSIRSVLAADASYAGIMGLELIAGRWYSQDESDSSSRLITVSSAIAEGLFGNVDNAIGSAISVERGIQRQGQGNQGRLYSESWEVIAVYENPSELARNALGIPDALIPFGSQQQGNRSPQISVFVARSKGANPAQIKTKIQNSLAILGHEEPRVSVWEGDPLTPNASVAAEARKLLTSLTGAILALGVLVLTASVFGIYTSTAMDVADGRKGTAIRRAIGESSGRTLLRFVTSNAIFGAAAAVLGVILSFPAYNALARTAETVIISSGLASGHVFPVTPPLWAPLLAILVSALTCALFSLPPAWSASRASVVEGIQEL